MKHNLLCIAAAVCLSLLMGCGTVGKDFKSTQVKSIKKQVTTKTQILEMFGLPFKEGKQDNFEIWTYKYDAYSALGKNTYKDLVIMFDEKGLVTSYRYTSTER